MRRTPVIALWMAVACGDDGLTPGDGGLDAGSDSGRDAAGSDGGDDAGTDGGDDASAADAGEDAGDAAIPPVDPVLYALTIDYRLLHLAPASPGTPIADVVIAGRSVTVPAIDVRPATGDLYGVTLPPRLIRIDPSTGMIDVIVTDDVIGTDVAYGMDVNPVTDRIRIVSPRDDSVRVHPETAMTVSDVALAYAPGDPGAGESPEITAVAYTSNVAGAASTTLFGIDIARDVLVRIGGPDGTPSPNTGLVFTVGPLGVDAQVPAGLDIAPDGRAFAVLTIDPSPSDLYTIDLTTGAATLVGEIDDAKRILGLAVAVPAP
jgi:hypothetical protein